MRATAVIVPLCRPAGLGGRARVNTMTMMMMAR